MLAVLLFGIAVTQATEGEKAAVAETAYARIGVAQSIAADASIVAAVVAKNLAPENAEQIQRRDKEWMANPGYALRKQLTENDCAARLRELSAPDAIIVEALVMDRQGAVVCSTVETQDYWQGDEAKWIKTYSDGGKVFVDDPALDQNTGMYAIQLSVPVSQGNKRIGALTLTLKVPRMAAKR